MEATGLGEWSPESAEQVRAGGRGPGETDDDTRRWRFRLAENARNRGTRRQLWFGALVLLILSAAANMASPLYPLLQEAHGMSESVMTALYATYVFSCLPSLLLFGSAADAFGRKPVLLAAVGLVGFGTAIFGVETAGIAGLFAGRALVGIGLGLGTGAGIALMVEASPARRVWLGSTLATISFVLGSGLGPILAGVVSSLSTSPLVLPFLVMTVLIAIVMVLIAMMPLQRPITRQRWRPTWPSVPGAMRTSFNIAALTGFIGWTALGLFLALLPSMAQSIIPNSGTLTSGLIVGSVLVVSAASQLVAPKFQPRAAQTLGLTLMGVGAALLLGSNLPEISPSAVKIIMVFAAVATGVGHGLSYWGANREIDVLTPPKNRAGISAALYLAFYAGAGAPAVIVGVLALGMPLVIGTMIFTFALLLATIVTIPVPSLSQTVIRQSRAEHAVVTRDSETAPGVVGSERLDSGRDTAARDTGTASAEHPAAR
ncbi:MFS transporter [Brevibacterium sp. S22]|nr:MFS transporter [Brevibacterium sp. S22]